MLDSLIREISARWGLADQGRPLVQMLVAYINNPATGGLSGFLEKFRKAGWGGMVNTWVSNEAIPETPTTAQVETVLGTGHDFLTQAGKLLGLTRDKVVAAVAGILPVLIGRMTPDGTIPATLPAEFDGMLREGNAMLGLGATTASASAGAVPPPRVAARAVDEPSSSGGLGKWLPWLIAALVVIFGVSYCSRDRAPADTTSSPATPATPVTPAPDAAPPTTTEPAISGITPAPAPGSVGDATTNGGATTNDNGMASGSSTTSATEGNALGTTTTPDAASGTSGTPDASNTPGATPSSTTGSSTDNNVDSGATGSLNAVPGSDTSASSTAATSTGTGTGTDAGTGTGTTGETGTTSSTANTGTSTDAAFTAPANFTAPEGADVLDDMHNGMPVLRVFFDTDKTDVAQVFAEKAKPLVEFLKANPDVTAYISGFNDPTGDAARNAELSKERAQAVKAALESAGVPAERAVLEKPADTTASASTHAEARRVDVMLRR